jgi:3-deoxy-7-phosphoheptulonate synthase
VVKRLSCLPVVVDPSHAAGHDYAVPALALAAAAAGADGLLIDVHPEPLLARCDGDQALLPVTFASLMADLERQLRSAGRALTLLSGIGATAR